ncbi:unnamed protein product, partial [Meganyctiphanes norvegica]
SDIKKEKERIEKLKNATSKNEEDAKKREELIIEAYDRMKKQEERIEKLKKENRRMKNEVQDTEEKKEKYKKRNREKEEEIDIMRKEIDRFKRERQEAKVAEKEDIVYREQEKRKSEKKWKKMRRHYKRPILNWTRKKRMSKKTINYAFSKAKDLRKIGTKLRKRRKM